jgi:hypothetical protein
MVLKKNFRLLRKPEPLDQEEESRQDFTVVLESRLLKEALFFQSTSILSLCEYCNCPGTSLNNNQVVVFMYCDRSK